MAQRRTRARFGRVEVLWVAALALGIAGVAAAVPPIPTIKANFFSPGTQPSEVVDPLIDPVQCAACHGYYDSAVEPYYKWRHSTKAQASRDPVFAAALAITEQDASYSAELCLRCHAPLAWLRGQVAFDTNAQSPSWGRSLPLQDEQKLGVACHVCHRMVDPVYQPGESPAADLDVLQGLATGVPPSAHNASVVIDPLDRRRGPFDLDADWASQPTQGWPGYHQFLQSPFHESSRLCATCHDVSTPHFTRQPGGTYTLNAVGQQPVANKYDQFPEQRTFSEWSQSLFAQGPVNLAGRFGGSELEYSSCQECHMQDASGQGCALEPPVRPDLPQHPFQGANTWILKAVRDIYPDSVTEMTTDGVNDSIARSVFMLQQASDTAVTQARGQINVRITNFTGHKLPTGTVDGRRMWINVKFRDAAQNIVAERGAYDFSTATLSGTDTKVYEAASGPDAALGAQLNLPSGPAFRIAIANRRFADNRIPPMGFTNAGFESVQAGSVPSGLYADGQYWDDTRYPIPAGARSAEVTVYYQTTSRQYVEFLRDANTSNGAGVTAYNEWALNGRSEPVVMDHVTLALHCPCDWNASGGLEVQDIFDFLASWFAGSGDFNGDGAAQVQDIFDFLACWFGGCA